VIQETSTLTILRAMYGLKQAPRVGLRG